MSAQKSKDVEWIVPGLVAAGAMTDVIGKVKAAGKTTFLTHMASAVLRGRKFMGLKTTRTPVVYLTEQHWASFREALKRSYLLDRMDFMLLQCGEVMGKTWKEVADGALRECKRLGARLLIVDTIAPFAQLSGSTENDSGHVLEALKPLQAATTTEIAVVIVQHERKGGGEVGEAGRGSTAFAGAADIVLTLSRRSGNGQENYRELKALSRFDETPATKLIELTDDGYVSHGAVRAIATEIATGSILDIVPSSKAKAMTIVELMEAGGLSRSTAQRAIKNLRSTAEIARCGAGSKNSPYRFWRLRAAVDESEK
jgi:hypothetical protein